MLSKKYYKGIGNILRELRKTQGEEINLPSLVISLSNYFEEDNPRFDRERFFEFVSKEE